MLMGVLLASVAGKSMSVVTTYWGTSAEQILRLLGRLDQLLADGDGLALVRQTLGMEESSFRRLRKGQGGMNIDSVITIEGA